MHLKLKFLQFNIQILKRAEEIWLLIFFLEYNLVSFCSIFHRPLFRCLRKGVSKLHVVGMIKQNCLQSAMEQFPCPFYSN